MSSRPPDAIGTRERLLDSAEALFAERGFGGTSVREITDRAEANLGAVNYHFRSKDNLYLEVFSRRVAQLRDPLVTVAKGALVTSRQRPEDALHQAGRAFLAPHQDRATSSRLLRLFARETIEACLPAGLLMRELLLPTVDAITAVVRRLRPDLPRAVASACAHSFLAQLMHIVKGAGPAAQTVEAQLEHAVSFTVAAVRHLDRRPGKKRPNLKRESS